MAETDFAGRTAVVTGAGGGMGLEIARDLMAAGARVAGIDVKERPGALDAALYAQGDVSDDGFVGEAIGRAFAATGRLDYLVNAAGILLFSEDRSLVEIELATWNRVLAINLTGCMLTARHAIPCMEKSGGGAMVHVSSIQCLRGDDRPQDAYQVAKAGILALSKSIAIQFAPAKDPVQRDPAGADREPDAGALAGRSDDEAPDRGRGAARPGRHDRGHGGRLSFPACPSRRPTSPAPS